MIINWESLLIINLFPVLRKRLIYVRVIYVLFYQSAATSLGMGIFFSFSCFFFQVFVVVFFLVFFLGVPWFCSRKRAFTGYRNREWEGTFITIDYLCIKPCIAVNRYAESVARTFDDVLRFKWWFCYILCHLLFAYSLFTRLHLHTLGHVYSLCFFF